MQMLETPTRRAAALMVGSALLLAPASGAALTSLFSPAAKLWPKWQAETAGSQRSVDHAPWDRLLQAYVRPGEDGVNHFAYGAVTATDKAALDAYIRALEEMTVRDLDRAEQLPFWINLYNALTIRVVLAAYPVASIRDIDISPGLFATGPWGKPLVRIEGEDVSLDDIEHRILRPIWRDARIHYAVNCASIGCPNLQPRAFTRANTEALMTAGAGEYVNHRRGVRVSGGGVTASSLYAWFKPDFGGSDSGVISHLRRHAQPDLDAHLAEARAIGDHGYDWALNDTR